MCGDDVLEEGHLKIAIYSKDGMFQHVAKQLPSGAWSSKVGPRHDLRHDNFELLEGVGVWDGASVELFVKRPFDGRIPLRLRRWA